MKVTNLKGIIRDDWYEKIVNLKVGNFHAWKVTNFSRADHAIYTKCEYWPHIPCGNLLIWGIFSGWWSQYIFPKFNMPYMIKIDFIPFKTVKQYYLFVTRLKIAFPWFYKVTQLPTLYKSIQVFTSCGRTYKQTKMFKQNWINVIFFMF